jgi:hypothetical protein
MYRSPPEDLSDSQCPLELPHELFQMLLCSAIGIYEIVVHTVRRFDSERRPQKKRSRFSEHLDATAIRRKSRNQDVREALLASDPWNDRCSHEELPCASALNGRAQLPGLRTMIGR